MAATLSAPSPGSDDEFDDTLILMFMCCHPSLTPTASIPLTLRAIGGLSTREIAAAFLVSEKTMGQRISRAKATIKASNEPFQLPPPAERDERMRLVLHVLYLIFNEGYVTSGGAQLTRGDLSAEAIRLTRMLHTVLPDRPEVSGLLALMLLTDARRSARTSEGGELIPLAEQDRSLWDGKAIAEGIRLLEDALSHRQADVYQLQAAIAAAHAEAPDHDSTDWTKILALYGLLERLSPNPMVSLNRAVAAGMVHGPTAGLAVLDTLEDQVGDHHRFHSVRAHLLEMSGSPATAATEYRAAASRTTNKREKHYLLARAADLTEQ